MPIRFYECTECRVEHDEIDPLFESHKLKQSKRGVNFRPDPPREKHTPGPWVFDLGVGTINGKDGISIVGYVAASPNERLANGFVLAAAPELLKALKSFVEHFGDPFKSAEAAIRKAEGK